MYSMSDLCNLFVMQFYIYSYYSLCSFSLYIFSICQHMANVNGNVEYTTVYRLHALLFNNHINTTIRDK